MPRHGMGHAVLLVGWLLASCSGGASGGAQAGGAAGTSGAGTAAASGAGAGGDSAGGGRTGGATSGGSTSGGASSGGSTSGGTTSGGSTSGGATSGGSTSGGASSGGSTSGGATSGGSTSGGASSGGAGGGGSGGVAIGGAAGAGAMMGCYVGVKLDDCCSQPVAADERWDDDPCLVPYPGRIEAYVLTACPAAEICLALDCTYRSPASRVVTRDAAGTCVFTDECSPSDIDCVVATDYNHCCSCPEVVPRLVVESDPCVLAEGVPPPGSCADCSAVLCGACPGETLVPSCGDRGDPPFATCMVAIP